MINKIFWFFKKIIKSLLFIYTYNSFFIGSNVLIPINIFTVVFISFFGVYGIIGIVVLSLII